MKWIVAFLILAFPVVIFAGSTGMPLRPFLFLLLFIVFLLFGFKVFLLLGKRVIKIFLNNNSNKHTDAGTLQVTKGLVWMAWSIAFAVLMLLAFGGFLRILKIIGF